MPTGTVKFYDTSRSYGFIKPDDGGPDMFVHVFELERAGIVVLVKNQRVEFERVPHRNGSAAGHIKLLT